MAAALMALGDGTWLERYHWTRDLTTANQIVLVVSPQVIMTVRIPVEYPGYFVVISIDRP